MKNGRIDMEGDRCMQGEAVFTNPSWVFGLPLGVGGPYWPEQLPMCSCGAEAAPWGDRLRSDGSGIDADLMDIDKYGMKMTNKHIDKHRDGRYAQI